MFEFIRRVFTQSTPQEQSDPHETERTRVLADVRERYRRELIGNLGEVDRHEAESIVRRMYRYAGIEPPRMFLWVDEPEEGLVAATLLTHHRLNHLPSLMEASTFSAQPLGAQIRRKLMASGAKTELSDNEVANLARWVPSLDVGAAVFRQKLAGKGLLSIGLSSLYALDSWLDAFLMLEEQFEFQSDIFTELWNEAAKDLYALPEQEHRDTLARLLEIGNTIFGKEDVWDWREPLMLSGSMEAVYGAVAELHQHNTDTARGGTPGQGIELLLEYMRHCGWCFPFNDFCIMTDRPEELFTLQDIDAERNIEARRLMIEMYGLGNYLQDKRARLLQSDEYGQLYFISQRDDEPLVVVKVVNSTPEPDGTFREYFLRVPPETTTARQGVAWSFDMMEHQYGPAKET